MTAPRTTAELREHARPLYDALVHHEFPRQLASGVLPPERFRFYVTQNLLYLPDYARMLAAGAARTHDDQTLAEFTRAVVNIVDVEIPQNERLREAIVALAGPVPEADTTKAPATVAYTSWLLAIAGSGNTADISAALLPCAWSYGDIALRLLPDVAEHPVYTDWIAFFASDEYAAVVNGLRTAFDRELAELSERERARLTEIFVTGCRLERQFWDQGLNATLWPDQRS
ncbi:thiaminase II [Microbacterium sp. 18062]|uniref:thiaminase II n=1 Tax=Microbacterium sp. 18062 TaxID=2681410 RepID=UPI001359DFBE|nr:thiaminase II [Microbacterium sp. 18062]